MLVARLDDDDDDDDRYSNMKKNVLIILENIFQAILRPKWKIKKKKNHSKIYFKISLN